MKDEKRSDKYSIMEVKKKYIAKTVMNNRK